MATHRLTDEHYTDERAQHLATASARVNAEILERPMDRVPGFMRLYRPQMCLMAGEVVAAASVRRRDGGRARAEAHQ